MSRVATRPVFTQTGQVSACVSGYHWKSPDVCCFLIWEEEVQQGRGLEGKRQSRGRERFQRSVSGFHKCESWPPYPKTISRPKLLIEGI